ncbi:GNAT family N-acetyltransferase [Dactylosporangium aurantiacum]|uniref:GNAT family N-acetyltransferase n=1 Tax=Dactylosporangium aurantiacum TaxID=35754 RepID=A0A9Q9MD03_9ACTN|nr:GNAT family N-acetyltransferase [Dactylosporangium aurantiacum]MDG6104999.1 GNAT family N-acetyltransferase [Dactylosporangium aurantiacum]UWZ51534.1 GNAT family N-acetyltransferase [Dactylosporangium aurantiacum]
MPALRITTPEDDATLEDWRLVHNTVVPDAAMSLDEARERLGRYLLEVVYDGDTLVGCTTVRPPDADTAAATVIVRVLPQWRGRGIGAALYDRAMGQAARHGAPAVETVVWEANEDGVRFARSRGFVEVDRYVPEPGAVAYLTLRLGPA